MIEKAIQFATKAHEGQKRKGTDRPYIVHPLEVGEIVKRLTDDPEVIAAAYLHDTIEDCKGVTAQILCEEFSERVADLVAKESEDKSKTWMERKSATIESLEHASYEAKLIALADKLSNIHDIGNEYPELGEELWTRFTMKDKKTIGWYYRGLRDVFAKTFEGSEVYEEYNQLVKSIFESE